MKITMEILVTVRNIEKYPIYGYMADGIIIGSLFTSGYDLSRQEMKDLIDYSHKYNKKVYVAIDDFIQESDRVALFEYFDFVVGLNPDGIYYHDMALLDAARKYGFMDKMIYDGKTIICNSLEAAFYLNTGIDSIVLSRELTLEEILPIVKYNPGRVDMQVFGHLRMSYSKRNFLTNYFKEIGEDYDYLNNKNLTITEEKRDYHMPILQDKSGTKIYSDFIFECYEELPELSEYLKRGIIDTLFINDQTVLHALRDYRRINKLNAQFLKNAFTRGTGRKYSTGYLYVKTNKTKDGKD